MPRTYEYRCDTCHELLILTHISKMRYETEDKGSLTEPCGDGCEGTMRRVWKVNALTHSTPGFYAHDNKRTPGRSPGASGD